MPEHFQGASPISAPLLLEWWKPVVGYEGLYEVSNVGNVCRIKKSNVSQPGYHLKKFPHWDGRLFVRLANSGVSKTKKVHKLMADAFLGGTPAGMTVHHKDDCYTHNRVSNFAFLTALDNWRDAYDKGLMPHGENSGNAKITEEQACEILRLRGKMSLRRISEKYGITTTAASYIWQGRNWAHLQDLAAMPPYRKTISKGEELPQAVLTAEKVREIRSQKGKIKPQVLAERYGVSHWTIYKVWSGRGWSHVV